MTHDEIKAAGEAYADGFAKGYLSHGGEAPWSDKWGKRPRYLIRAYNLGYHEGYYQYLESRNVKP